MKNFNSKFAVQRLNGSGLWRRVAALGRGVLDDNTRGIDLGSPGVADGRVRRREQKEMIHEAAVFGEVGC